MLITAAVLFFMKIAPVISGLEAYPLNTAVLAGQRMELKCKTNQNESVNRWTATRVGQPVEVIFQAELQTNSAKEQVDSPVHNNKFPYFGVQFRQNGDCILYSNRTELKDAGIYTCSKSQDTMQSSAQLTVVESNTVCESNISSGKNDISVSPDVNIWIRCSVNFSSVGYWHPSMEWIQHYEDTQVIRNDSVTITTNTAVTSVLHVSNNLIENGSYFSCTTFFKQYNGPIKTSASNIPDFRFIWNSNKINFQENTFNTAKNHEVKDILMSSDSQMDTTVTNALIDSIVADSSINYWFFVSLSLVAVVSIFFVLLAIRALNFYICRKRNTTGREDPVHASSFTSLDHPISDEYEIMPYAYTDGYDKIDDINATDIDFPIQFPRRERPLPTPGYDNLLSQPSIPTVYSPIDNYEQPMDREDVEISLGLMPESKQYSDIDKSDEHSTKVKVKLPAYIQLISESEEEDSSPSFSSISVAGKEINRSSITSSDSINEIPSSYLKINEDATKDGFDPERNSSSSKK